MSDNCSYLISPDKWFIPDENEYGWTVKPGSNEILVRTNTDCGVKCIYIDDNPITY